MAVYEHRYRPYVGAFTPAWSRFLIIPRHALRDAFRSKSLTAFFAFSFVPPLVFAILIYLHHNLNAIRLLEIDLAELVPIGAEFFFTFLTIQAAAAFFLTLLVAPSLVSRDLANNALPLYLARPLSRFEYTAGKMSVVVVLMSFVTWIPAALLFALQSYLEGSAWAWVNIRIAFGLVAGSMIWILFLALLSQTLSAWFKWRVVASGGMVASLLIPTAIAGVLHETLFRAAGNNDGSSLANVISPLATFSTIWANLFALPTTNNFWMMPAWGAWLALAVMCLALAGLLSRKVRAYEVA